MSGRKAVSILLLFISSFGVKGYAATVIAAGTKTVAACSFAVTPTAEFVIHLPYPEDWKIVGVSRENVWDTLMRQDK